MRYACAAIFVFPHSGVIDLTLCPPSSGCYGLTDEELALEVWQCEACSNEKTLDASLNPCCILCPPPKPIPLAIASSNVSLQLEKSSARVGRKSTNNNPLLSSAATGPAGAPLSVMEAVKPTECNNWTHVVCALFMPDIVLTEPERMKTVEGAGNLPLWRYQAMCDLCHEQSGGACVTCNEPSCKRAFHVSCAWQAANFVLGFDIQPVKSSRRDTVPTASFRGESGHMSAVVYCNLHRDVGKNKGLHDWADIDSTTGLTAAQTYATTHKSVSNDRAVSTGLSASISGAAGVTSSLSASAGAQSSLTTPSTNAQTSSSTSLSEQTYGLLRRAKRLDLALNQLQQSQQGVHLQSYMRSSSSNKRLSTSFINASLSATPAPPTVAISGQQMTLLHNLNDANANTASSIHLIGANAGAAGPKCCARCQSRFSPFWFDVPADARELDEEQEQEHGEERDWLKAVKEEAAASTVLCLRCRHAVVPPLQ